MQTEFRTILWRRGLSMMLFVLFSVTVAMAQVLVRGTVVDQTGESVIGASIQVKGTTQGTITDIDGKFSLGVPDKKSVIVVSFIGYATKELQVDTSKPMSIVLEEDTKVLDEVVVVGYQEVRKKDLTGSVAKADMNELLNTPVGSFDQNLGGRIAGVNVSSSEGTPGGTMNIVIRGNNSLTQDNSPLYVIDGFPVEDAAIASTINPSDIESLDILKDASATAIYGARGANGVVIITTKKGKVGKAQLSYDGSVTMQHVTRTIPMMDAYEFVKLQAEMYPEQMTSSNGGYLMEWEGKQWTLEDYRNIDQYNWQDEIFRTGITQNYKVAVSSGNDKTQFYLSGNYMGQTGVVIESKNERYQAKANVTSQVTPWLHVTADVNASHNIRKGGSFATGKDNPIWIAMNYSPTMQMMDGNNYAKDPINSIASNPVGILRLQGGETMTDVFTGHVDLRFNLAKGLTFTTTNGVDYYDAKSYSFSSKRVNPSNSMGNSDTYRMMLQSSNNFTYKRLISWFFIEF